MPDTVTWKWSQRPGLNWRPLLYESIALPLSYAGKHSFYAAFVTRGIIFHPHIVAEAKTRLNHQREAG